MNDDHLIGKINEKLAGKTMDVTHPAPRRIFVKVEPRHLVEVVRFLKSELGFSHLCTITGADLGDSLEFLYHFANSYANVNVRVPAARDGGKIPTITGVVAGAILYERELQEMFGITVENIPDPRRLNLPDEWPQGAYPLRKDFKVERKPEVIPGGK